MSWMGGSANKLASSTRYLEKFSESTGQYASYDEYLLANSPEAKISSLIDEYGLQKHLGGIEVQYAGSRTGKLGGVDPLNPKIIKVYNEGLSLGDREFVELMIEETHHSKLMGLFPLTREPAFNQTWNSVVEPRAKAYAKAYADGIFGKND